MGLVAERESGKFEGAKPPGKISLSPPLRKGENERDFNKERGIQGGEVDKEA